MEFSLDVLSALIADSTVRGLSITRELQPLGGRGDTVSPPTFAQPEGGEKGPRYVWSERRIGDAMVKTCLLDSPASQANRLEESLLEFVRAGMLTLPLHRMEVPYIGELTDLELPHRTYDAAIGTAKLTDGTDWKKSKVAKLIREASRKKCGCTPRARTPDPRPRRLGLALGNGSERLARPPRESGLVQDRRGRRLQDERSGRASRSDGSAALRIR